MLTQAEQVELSRIREYYRSPDRHSVKLQVASRDVSQLVSWVMMLQDLLSEKEKQLGGKEREMEALRRAMIA